MRKYNTFLIIALGLTIGSSQEWSIKSQIRSRYEAVDKDFLDSTGFNQVHFLRSRVGISFKNENVRSFFQFQDMRVFGSETNTLTDGSADNLDLHQGYFKIADFFDFPVDLKVGRFESAYGPQRFIGSVGWHNIGRSFDGGVLTFKHKRFNIDFFNYKEIESQTIDSDDDFNVQGIYANMNLLDGHTTHAFIIQDGERLTYGGYAKGDFSGINYEVEFALQGGNDANDKFDGLMYALNAGYKLAGINFSAGIDFISGDDTSTTDMNESFNTLYATNHKYYGYMDYFLNIPTHTAGYGLQDLHFKFSGLSYNGFVLKGACHIFNADQSDDLFGNEIDLTLVKKYSNNVKLVGGYSLFMPGKLKSDVDDPMNASFLYFMTIVNF